MTQVANNFEGSRVISHLPFEQQLSQIFNPLHHLTKTPVNPDVSPGSFTVPHKK
jgi:hypothetical protein